jgi:hypothetical protein
MEGTVPLWGHPWSPPSTGIRPSLKSWTARWRASVQWRCESAAAARNMRRLRSAQEQNPRLHGSPHFFNLASRKSRTRIESNRIFLLLMSTIHSPAPSPPRRFNDEFESEDSCIGGGATCRVFRSFCAPV